MCDAMRHHQHVHPHSFVLDILSGLDKGSEAKCNSLIFLGRSWCAFYQSIYISLKVPTTHDLICLEVVDDDL